MKIIKHYCLIIILLNSILFCEQKYESEFDLNIIPNFYTPNDIALVITPNYDFSDKIVITCLVPEVFNITDQKSYDLYLDTLSNKITFQLFSVHDKNYFAYQYIFEQAIDTLILYSEEIGSYNDLLDVNILGRYFDSTNDEIKFNINFYEKPTSDINAKFFINALDNNYKYLFDDNKLIQDNFFISDSFKIRSDSTMSKISFSYKLNNDTTYDLNKKQTEHIELFSTGIEFVDKLKKFDYAHIIILSGMSFIFFILLLIALVKIRLKGRLN